MGELPEELKVEELAACRGALLEADVLIQARAQGHAADADRLITPEEAANYAGVSRALVVRWARPGPAWAFRPSPRTLKVWRAVFIGWIRSRRTPLTRPRTVASAHEGGRTDALATRVAGARPRFRARGKSW